MWSGLELISSIRNAYVAPLKTKFCKSGFSGICELAQIKFNCNEFIPLSRQSYSKLPGNLCKLCFPDKGKITDSDSKNISVPKKKIKKVISNCIL